MMIKKIKYKMQSGDHEIGVVISYNAENLEIAKKEAIGGIYDIFEEEEAEEF